MSEIRNVGPDNARRAIVTYAKQSVIIGVAYPEDMIELEMDLVEATALVDVLPGVGAYYDTSKCPPAHCETAPSRANLVLPSWLGTIVWEVRHALVFRPAGTGGFLDRSHTPEVIMAVFEHTPRQAFEGAFRLMGTAGARYLLADALRERYPSVRLTVGKGTMLRPGP